MSSFRVITAPTLTPLFDRFVGESRLAPLPPREMETIVVQAQGMRRWLTLQHADALGCAGSLDLPFPANFVRDIAQRVDADRGGRSDRDPFSRDALAWRLDGVLQRLPARDAVFAPLHSYLAGSDARARFDLATQIAGRFDDYQLYRADLLQEWEAGRNSPDTPHATWQAAIWRAMCADVGSHAPHLAARMAQTIHTLQSRTSIDLPSRITVFGVSALPPVFIELLAALSRSIPVTVYVAAIADDSTHPLALSLATQSREFLAKLHDAGAVPTRLATRVNNSRALLPTIQRELDTHVDSATPLTVSVEDASLRIHSAHGDMRQLEILRDQLIAALADDPTLRPHDMLLLVPDAAAWAPLVDAVFGVSDADGVRVPYRIADRPTSSTQPAAHSFSQLLALHGGRLPRSEVFALLVLPLIRQGAGLAESDVYALRRLTERANVRWGYDAVSRAALGLPAYEDASWRASLDRLLLGVVLGRTDDLVLGVLPEAGDTSGDPEILAKLASWVDALAETLAGWDAPRTLDEWRETLSSAIERFLVPEGAGEPQLIAALHASIRQLSTVGDLAQYADTVSFGVVRDWLDAQLDVDGFGSGFLMGGMTVAALKPMRSLPFRVIAVAGLDDGVFPRRERRTAFDLLDVEHRRGDRDMQSDDRQLFLDILLSAQDKLILAYTGHAVTDNSPRAASVVIDELLNHLDRRTAGAAREALVVKHPLQPFSRAYFATPPDPRVFSFSQTQARTAEAIANETSTETPFVTEALRDSSAGGPVFELTLRDLTDCWTNPSKYFCRQILRVSFDEASADVNDEELFTLSVMEAGLIKSQLLASAQRGEHRADVYRRRTQASGKLPIGELGEAWYDGLSADVDAVLAQLPNVPVVTVPFNLERDGWRVQGRFDGIRGDTRFVARAGSIRADHRIRAWVEHVVMCAARELGVQGLPSNTVIVGRKAKDDFRIIETLHSVTNAIPTLTALISAVQRGRAAPLPFFAQAGVAWLDAMQPPKTKTKTKTIQRTDPRAAAEKAYSEEVGRYNKIGGDCEDAYVQLVFRGREPLNQQWNVFAALATTLFAPRLPVGGTE